MVCVRSCVVFVLFFLSCFLLLVLCVCFWGVGICFFVVFFVVVIAGCFWRVALCSFDGVYCLFVLWYALG